MATNQPLAYHDHDFLESTDARPLRILAEYLEPLKRFREANIQDTVVFFGSARVHSREHAEELLQKLTRAKKKPRRTGGKTARVKKKAARSPAKKRSGARRRAR